MIGSCGHLVLIETVPSWWLNAEESSYVFGVICEVCVLKYDLALYEDVKRATGENPTGRFADRIIWQEDESEENTNADV